VPETPTIFHNVLLNALSPADLDLLRPDLEFVELKLRDCLEPAHQKIQTVYFMESGLASVVARSKGDRTIEVGLIGIDGMTGVNIVMGDDRSTNETFVQVAGSAVRIKAATLVAALDSRPSLRNCLLRYVQAFFGQITHTALANGRAKIEERLARWILMAHDRLGGDEIHLTHEFLALMLGVRRPGVTVALHLLEGQGLIKSGRGVLTILDRKGMEAIADGSYGAPEAEYARLLRPISMGR
jgi:CRP-like cAMP-binding protein